MKESKLKLHVLMNEKHLAILRCLKNNNTSVPVRKICKQLKRSDTYIYPVLKKFYLSGLLEFDDNNKYKLYRISDKGLEIAQLIEKIIKLYGE